MINQIPINVFRLLLLLAAQLMIFNNINFSTFVNPYIYPLFVLLLPFETPRWLMITLGFLSGLLLDFMMGSGGMHASAGLLIGYFRPFLINVITPKGGEFEITPNIYAQGVVWFVAYLGVSIFLYLLLYFMIEAATFQNILLLFFKTILSTVVSVTFMLIFLFLFSNRKKRRFA